MFSSGMDLSVPCTAEILFTTFINSMHRTAESAGENEMQSHEKFSQSEARCQIQSGGQMVEIKHRHTGKDQQRADLLTLGSCLYFPLTLCSAGRVGRGRLDRDLLAGCGAETKAAPWTTEGQRGFSQEDVAAENLCMAPFCSKHHSANPF